MAMMIVKFHRLIQSKLLWGFFLVVIVFSFVIWGMVATGSGNALQHQSREGRLNGRTIAPEEFRLYYDQIRLDLFLRMGRFPEVTDDLNRIMRRSAWQRMATVTAAEKMGFQAGDDEVRREIESISLFQEEGRFSPARYKAFAQNILANMGYGPRFFEEYIRNEMTSQRYLTMVAQSVLVPPYDIERNTRMLKDTFKVEYALFPASLVENDIQVTPDVAMAFFERNAQRYEKPEKVRVHYVHVAAAPYKSQVSMPTEEQAREYYEDHLEEFTPPTPARKAGDTNAVETVSAPKAFIEVKAEIVQRILNESARSLANSVANQFYDYVDSGKDGKPMTFEAAAAALNLTVATTEPFARNGTPPGLDVSKDFVDAAFGFDPEEGSTVSAPIPAADGYYIIKFAERIPAQIPTFGEVSGPAMEDARADAVATALEAKAQEFKTEVETAGAVFADVAKKFGVTAATSEPFALADPLPTFTNAALIARAVVKLNAGGVTDPLPASGGSLVVARVIERKPADASQMDAMRGQLVEYLAAERTRITEAAWSKSLLDSAKLEDRVLEAEKAEKAEKEETGKSKDAPADPADAK